MLSDQCMKGLKIIRCQSVHFDGEMVSIKGKIGETTNLPIRIRTYYECQHRNGMYDHPQDFKSAKNVNTVDSRSMIVSPINYRFFSLIFISYPNYWVKQQVMVECLSWWGEHAIYYCPFQNKRRMSIFRITFERTDRESCGFRPCKEMKTRGAPVLFVPIQLVSTRFLTVGRNVKGTKRVATDAWIYSWKDFSNDFPRSFSQRFTKNCLFLLVATLFY